MSNYQSDLPLIDLPRDVLETIAPIADQINLVVGSVFIATTDGEVMLASTHSYNQMYLRFLIMKLQDLDEVFSSDLGMVDDSSSLYSPPRRLK